MRPLDRVCYRSSALCFDNLHVLVAGESVGANWHIRGVGFRDRSVVSPVLYRGFAELPQVAACNDGDPWLLPLAFITELPSRVVFERLLCFITWTPLYGANCSLCIMDW